MTYIELKAIVDKYKQERMRELYESIRRINLSETTASIDYFDIGNGEFVCFDSCDIDDNLADIIKKCVKYQENHGGVWSINLHSDECIDSWIEFGELSVEWNLEGLILNDGRESIYDTILL